MSSDHARLQQAAADWLVKLGADEERDRRAAEAGFAAWRSESPDHERVAQSMQGMLGRIHALQGTPASSGASRAAMAAQRKSSLSRTRALQGTALLMVMSFVAWMALTVYPPRYLLADVRTASGQWQTMELADGSSITLDGNSAVNIRFDDKQRVLELTQGDVLVQVAHDAGRPFIVKTAQGSMRALGTRFVVQSEPSSTVLSVIESRVLARTQRQERYDAPDDGVVVEAGHQLRFTAEAQGEVESVNASRLDTAWKNHLLVVKATPMGEVLRQLGRHHRGVIHFNAARLADISVSAVLPLDDTTHSLQLLKNSLPQLRIRTFTPYIVWVDVDSQAASATK